MSPIWSRRSTCACSGSPTTRPSALQKHTCSQWLSTLRISTACARQTLKVGPSFRTCSQQWPGRSRMIPPRKCWPNRRSRSSNRRYISSIPGSGPPSSTTAGMAARCRRLRPGLVSRGRWSRNISPGPFLSSAIGCGKRSREASRMSPYQGKPFNQQLYSEAAAWLIEFRSGDIDVAGRKAFYDWLRTSPEHMRAYLELAAIWNEGSALDPAHSVADGGALETSEPETNVIALNTLHSERPRAIHDTDRSPPTRVSARRVGPKMLYLAASLLLAASAALQWYWHDVRGVYTTGVGEQHLITLSDGSVIELNA